jgi:hypothetical protein
MNNIYKIEGTNNLHKEQHRKPYTTTDFWPTFQEDMNIFKNRIINCVKNKISFSLLRIGHSEFSLFNSIIPNKKGVGNLRGRHSNGTEKKEDHKYYYESLIKSDYITTQIGYGFKKWLNDVINYKNQYIKFKNDNKLDKLFKNPKLFLNNHKKYRIDQLINIPLDIIYGLCANKWFLKTFKNRIGLIGNIEKLKLIEKLLEYQEYRDYLGIDYFKDYIYIKQRAALNDSELEKYIEEKVKNSTCDIFLCGMGVSKLRIFYKLKEIKNCVYIDVGCGICALAGTVDIRRPYMGSWKNYRLKNYDYSKIEQIDWYYGLKLPGNNNQVFIE